MRTQAAMLLALCLLATLAVAAAPAAAPTAATDTTPESTLENAPTTPDRETPPPVPPAPPRITDDATYQTCMDRLATDPAGAQTIADTLAGQGLAEPATHCRALAQIELGNPQAGAGMLDSLAGSSQAPAASRAELFGQASTAWTMAGDAGHALQSAAQALTLAPDDPDLLVAHAIAAIAMQNPKAAVSDLDAALAADPSRNDARLARATANRLAGHIPAASADITAVLQTDPANPDALLERGVIRQRAGDLAGARADWQRVGDLAADTAIADQAEQYLALLAASPPNAAEGAPPR